MRKSENNIIFLNQSTQYKQNRSKKESAGFTDTLIEDMTKFLQETDPSASKKKELSGILIW